MVDPTITLYPIRISLTKTKNRTLYFDNRESAKSWLQSIKMVSQIRELTQEYSTTEVLGKGQFGVVKLATHRQNHTAVAIKTVSKENFNSVEKT